MRRKDREIADRSVMDGVIQASPVCRIAMVTGTAPYLVPMSFGYDGSNIYIHSALSGEKVEILKANSQVCIEFEQGVEITAGDKPCNWSARFQTVIARGRAELVLDSREKSQGLAEIIKRYDPAFGAYTFSETELNKVNLYKISVEEISGKISG